MNQQAIPEPLTVSVALGERSYTIRIGAGLLHDSSQFADLIRNRQVMIVTNEVVGPLYLPTLKKTLSGLDGRQVFEVILADGESIKNLDSLERIVTELLEARCNRGVTLIALGGGVIGDLTGFTAACYQRGVAFVQVPTTLLAMVDSSVGGKTAVNHRLGKNMIGAFHQPAGVVVDIALLASLPRREFSAGLAEVIKYGLIRDADFLGWLDANLEKLQNLSPSDLQHMVAVSCRCKAAIVAEDETEQGVRALLNLGHTFGHAIEAWCGYRDWLHGEAVATGMLMAADLSCRMGWIPNGEVQRLQCLLRRLELPVRPPAGMDAAAFEELMAVDKKVSDAGMKLVLLRAVGDGLVTSDFSVAKLRETLAHFTASA